jgi:hypothetical protein
MKRTYALTHRVAVSGTALLIFAGSAAARPTGSAFALSKMPESTTMMLIGSALIGLVVISQKTLSR